MLRKCVFMNPFQIFLGLCALLVIVLALAFVVYFTRDNHPESKEAQEFVAEHIDLYDTVPGLKNRSPYPYPQIKPEELVTLSSLGLHHDTDDTETIDQTLKQNGIHVIDFGLPDGHGAWVGIFGKVTVPIWEICARIASTKPKDKMKLKDGTIVRKFIPVISKHYGIEQKDKKLLEIQPDLKIGRYRAHWTGNHSSYGQSKEALNLRRNFKLVWDTYFKYPDVCYKRAGVLTGNYGFTGQYRFKSNVIGLHFRSKDHLNPEPKEITPDQYFQMFIDMAKTLIHKDTKINGIYIACRMDKPIRVVKESFPNLKVMYDPDQTRMKESNKDWLKKKDKTEEDESNDCIVDMLCLSQCKYIIAIPSNVTFTASCMNLDTKVILLPICFDRGVK